MIFLLLLSMGALVAQTLAPKPAAPKPTVPKPKPAAVKPAAPKPPAPKPAEPAVITAGDIRISKSDFERYVEALPPAYRAQMNSSEAKRKFANQLVEVFLLAQEARRRKLDQDPKTIAKIRLDTNQALAQALIAEVSAAPADEAALRHAYDENKSQYEQLSGRHILIRFKGSAVPLKPDQKDLSEEESLAKIQDLRRRIQSGEDFADLARKESDDTGSGAAGGSLGSFGRGQMVRPFEEAAFSLAIGQLSEPVKTQFGYHLIQIQEKKNQTFEEARHLVEQRRRPELTKQLADDLKKKAPVTLDESYFSKP